jgi:hypothetical protein
MGGGTSFPRFRFPPAKSIGKLAEQSDQVVEVATVPIGKQRHRHTLSRYIHCVCGFLSDGSYQRFVHPLVARRYETSYESKLLKSRNLPADCRVVAANTTCQFNNTNRAKSLDRDKQRKKRSFK